MIEIPVCQRKLKNYTFIDLFAGIGGFHYALQAFDAKCVFASEIDEKGKKTYQLNHGIFPQGDITKIKEEEIPAHDILCGGFPCQAFSISGKQKGFEDTRGTLFFDIARIISFHKPKVVFLENVKNFVQHDNANSLKTVLKTLKNLGYKTHYQVLNSSNFGLPQNRERLYIVAFLNDYDTNEFCFPSIKMISSLEDVLEQEPLDGKIIERNDINLFKNYSPNKNIFGELDLPNRPIQIGKVNKGGQGERIYHPLGHAITLSAYGGGAGAKTGLYQINGKIRKLSPRECARVQGFPEDFIYPESVTEAHKQFGNSVSIDVLQYIIFEIIKVIQKNEEKTKVGFKNSKRRIQKRKEHRHQI